MEQEFLLPENPFPVGTQCHTLFEWLRDYGEITTWDIHNTLCMDTARLRSDVRPILRQHGIDYVCKPTGERNNRLYQLIEDEPDVEAILEDRRRPTYREQAMMERGVEVREGRG